MVGLEWVNGDWVPHITARPPGDNTTGKSMDISIVGRDRRVFLTADRSNVDWEFAVVPDPDPLKDVVPIKLGPSADGGQDLYTDLHLTYDKGNPHRCVQISFNARYRGKLPPMQAFRDPFILCFIVHSQVIDGVRVWSRKSYEYDPDIKNPGDYIERSMMALALTEE